MSLESTKTVLAAPRDATTAATQTAGDPARFALAGKDDARSLWMSAPFLLAALAWLYFPTVAWL